MRHTVGLIRVVTLMNEGALNLHGRIIESASPELRMISRSTEDQPMGIYDRESEEVAKPKILRLAGEFEREGVEAVREDNEVLIVAVPREFVPLGAGFKDPEILKQVEVVVGKRVR